MIYLTGDTHSDFTRFNRRIFPEQRLMTKEDYVIILGDFGGVWDEGRSGREEKYWLDWLDSKTFTTLFIDGNHENYDRLDAMAVDDWKGGKIHKIRDSVFHLMRGQVYEIDGNRFFTFGGARSHDISGGIIEKDDKRLKNTRWLKKYRNITRINHVNWWKQEMPSSEQKREGISNLRQVDWTVDYILTHCAPSRIQESIDSEHYKQDELTEYLEKIKNKCKYRYWFCGHYHENRNINSRDKVIYEQIIRIW